ncbi:isochorismatase family protein [Rhodococcus sp. WMMA185]|uniref:isochorismatase family protein n=1 Tax=Rhodococcus sp. WMMA185 TaxID=679318 RepID=UPI001E397C79|nr:isochorismatase family protein [Rhodococcus sp. WMMA185]
MDLTRGFTEPGFPSGSDLTDVVLATAQLCEAARKNEVPIVYTKVEYTSAELEGGSIAWMHKAPGLRELRQGTEAVAFDPRLAVTPADHIICKKGVSAFFGTPLASLLTGLRRDTVIVCGATTSGCVRATVVDAVQSGFCALVPRECVGDRAEGPHEANLFDINAKYGDVLDLSDTLDYLAAAQPGASR